MNKGIFKEQLEKLIGDKFGKYSKYIIQDRALPDLRDGLKPVQRRILFAMSDLKLFNTSPYKKSARVVGDVIGKYHPHGDTSVYEAMVRMAQDWKQNIPLVDMHGNKGSIDGDSPAAMRYTEARLSKISEYLLLNIQKNLIPFSPNFDDSELEPSVLPALYPNLLVNGATGIAAGYATNIPPHNITEVIEALIYVLKHEDISLSAITKFIKGPDFPTGGSVQSSQSIKDAYKTGKGKVVIRAKVQYIKKENEIHVTEIPYESNKADIVKNIDEIIRAGKLPGLREIRDDSDRKGMQITIICKPGLNVEATLNYLFKNTDLQKNYSINMVCIKEKKPQLLPLVDILLSFKDFQIEIYENLYKYELAKARKRFEIVEGLIKAVQNIDVVIREIRSSKNRLDAKERIIEKLDFTDLQADAIVNLRLYRLSSTDIEELIDERQKLEQLIDHYSKGLRDRDYLVENIILELEKIMQLFPIARRTIVEEELEDIEIDEKSLIQEEEVNVVITQQGYIKKVSNRSKDASLPTDLGIRAGDIPISSITVSNTKNLFIFTSSGKYYTIPVYKINEFRWKDIGDHIGKYFGVTGEEKIVGVSYTMDFENQGNTTLVISTYKGLIKQIELKEVSVAASKKGIKFINLKAGDSVNNVSIACDQNYYVVSITKDSKVIRYPLSDVGIIGLNTSGVKNIGLDKNDYVVSTLIDTKEKIDSQSSQFFLITDNGKGKRFRPSDVKLTSRAGKGIMLLKPVKTNPHTIINVVRSVFGMVANIMYEDGELQVEDPKSLTPLTTLDEGLSQVSKKSVKSLVVELLINVDKCFVKSRVSKSNYADLSQTHSFSLNESLSKDK